MQIFVLCFLCFGYFTTAKAQTGANAKALREKLFVTDKYDKKVRSAENQSEPTEVEVGFYLLSIHELDEVKELLKSTGYLEVTWRDDFLKWTPADYGGIESAFFPQDDIWKPDVALKNSMVEYKQLGDAQLNAVVTSSGHVQWIPYQVFQSSCSVNIKYFPFDIQTCKLKFVAWSYSKAEVDMRADKKGIVLEQYEPSSEWDIIASDATVEEESGEASIIFSVTIRRKPRYLFLSIMFPIIMLSVLDICVFVLPSDSGEKASYAITVFLAFAVFLTIVASSLPENSDSTALFSVYILIQTSLSTLVTVIALIQIRLYNLGPDKDIPKWLLAFVKTITCKRCINRSTVEPDRHDVNGGIPNEKENLNISKDRFSHTEAGEMLQDGKDDIYDWKRLVNTLDWFFLVLFSVLVFVSTILCFVLAYAVAS